MNLLNTLLKHRQEMHKTTLISCKAELRERFSVECDGLLAELLKICTKVAYCSKAAELKWHS